MSRISRISSISRIVKGIVIKVNDVKQEQTSGEGTDVSVVIQDEQKNRETILIPKATFDEMFPNGCDSAIGQKLIACACCNKCPKHTTCYQCFTLCCGNVGYGYQRPACQHTERMPTEIPRKSFYEHK